MRKQAFLAQLSSGLAGLPRAEKEERLTFYSEMIDDRMEEGLSEEAAVGKLGDVNALAAQILAEAQISKSAKENVKPRKRMRVWEILLLVLGAPIWGSLLIAALAVLFSLYVVLWSVIISLWSVAISLAACSVGGVLACIVFALGGNGIPGAAMLAAGLICAGLTIFAFYGCKAATMGALTCTKKIAGWIKNSWIRKEAA